MSQKTEKPSFDMGASAETTEQISETLSDRIHKKIVSLSGRHEAFAHVEPQITPDLTPDEKALDSIARIIGIGHTVGALLWGERENQFLVATNDGHSQADVANRFTKFRNIANASEENMSEAIRDFREYVYDTGYDISPQLKQLFIANLDDFAYTLSPEDPIREPIQGLRSALSNPDLDLNTAVQYAETLLRYKTVKANPRVANSIGKIYRAKQDVDRAITYITKHKYQFNGIATEPKFRYLRNRPENVHAEMKILEALLSKKYDDLPPLGRIYIANSKRCCASCGRAIDAVKELRPDLLGITTSGKSEKFYGWPIPNFILQDERLAENFLNRIPNNEEPKNFTRGPDERPLTPPRPLSPEAVTVNLEAAPAPHSIALTPPTARRLQDLSTHVSRTSSFNSIASNSTPPDSPVRRTSSFSVEELFYNAKTGNSPPRKKPQDSRQSFVSRTNSSPESQRRIAEILESGPKTQKSAGHSHIP